MMKTSQKIRPFQLNKKNSAGENSKMIQGAVFLAGRVPALLAQSSGLSLRASLEIGSSFGVKCHHIGAKTEIVALWGDFFGSARSYNLSSIKKYRQTIRPSDISWCGLGDSNSWPLPWQGSALTTELNPHVASFIKRLLEWTR